MSEPLTIYVHTPDLDEFIADPSCYSYMVEVSLEEPIEEDKPYYRKFIEAPPIEADHE